MSITVPTITQSNLPTYIAHVAQSHATFKSIVDTYGNPPYWHREPGFTTLLQIILEQQVSIAAARAAYRKLEEMIEVVTPERILEMSDQALRECYFSRQKARYAKALAHEIIYNHLDLAALDLLYDEEVREKLIAVKGIGNWTANIYLLISLHRPDIFPVGDLAAVKALKDLGCVDAKATKTEIVEFVAQFNPYRSVVTILLWHKYIQDRGMDF